MKIFILLTFASIGLLSQIAYATECSVKGNVRDYFIALAQNEVEIFDDNKGAMKMKSDLNKAIEVLDIKNGFLQLQDKTITSTITAALFVIKTSKVIAIVKDDSSVQNQQAFECKDGKFVDISKIFFPVYTFEKISELYKKNNVQLASKKLAPAELKMVAHSLVRFKLPRKGKEISLYSSHPDQAEEKVLDKFVPSIN